MLASCNPENPEDKFQLYMQIIDFFKGLSCANTQVKQVGQSRGLWYLRPPLLDSKKGS